MFLNKFLITFADVMSTAGPARGHICFIASVHPHAFEPRLFHREAASLVRAGYAVTLIVGHDRSGVVDGVDIIALDVPSNRWWRTTGHALKVFRLALATRAAAYHFHSPEFIPWALLLRALGKPVIYDAHEAYRDKVATRTHVPKLFRAPIGRVINLMERLASHLLSHVFAADSHVAAQFRSDLVTVLANYPVLSQVRAAVAGAPGRATDGRTVVAYVGDLTRERGITQMLDAMDLLHREAIQLRLLGRWERQDDADRAAGMANVHYGGFVPMVEVFRELAAAHVGLVVLQPVPAYRYAGENTNKLFEYLALGLAVVASDFPNLRRFVADAGTGYCVDPASAADLAAAVRHLHEHPEERAAMGERGRRAVEERWNWEAEQQKLLDVYARLLPA